MPFKKPQLATITLFFCFALVLSLASFTDASLYHNNNHNRLLKKRAPQILRPLESTSESTAGVSTTASAPTSASTGRTSASLPTASSASSNVVGSVSSTPLTAAVSSTSASLSSTSTSSIATTSSAATSSVTDPATSSIASSSTKPRSTLTQTETLGAATPTSSLQPQSANSKAGKTTFTVIIIIASVAGGVTILWTIFRKWKLARSSKFDERLQPIDWQPTTETDGRHRPTSVASSFHSAGHSAGTVTGHGGGYGPGSDHGHGSSDHGHPSNLAPLPDHDFTPLPSSRAPVGTYADLARGPSPQPQIHDNYARGPMFNRPAYDVHVPLHHQAGYGAYDYNTPSMRY
ncbi:hypothetical protein AMATHDRAFT_44605 [Amanita thiersii Skay4041]|uniref:Mid2 domain-containing protein n=1 Tax=Amanita thiersii Skay4041 TaxID=703135 RepID=A0A2A9NUZ7_9AGAR|nr:hypothetical protein AMATHDRAFT_44605 [Amanita thiersii Skay4041]